MRIFVYSDIHGSAYYAEKIYDIIRKNKFDKICILGDVLYHGPRNPLPEGHNPMKVVELVNKYKDITLGVRGNCDAEIDRVLCEFPMSNDYEEFCLRDGRKVFMTHGHIQKPDFHKPLEKGTIFLYGHYHVPKAEVDHGIYLCNPGSISLPKENNPNSYGILTEEGFTVYDFDGKVLRNISFE